MFDHNDSIAISLVPAIPAANNAPRTAAKRASAPAPRSKRVPLDVRAVLDTLYRTEHGALVSLAATILKNRVHAEDAVQAAYLDVLQKALRDDDVTEEQLTQALRSTVKRAALLMRTNGSVLQTYDPWNDDVPEDDGDEPGTELFL